MLYLAYGSNINRQQMENRLKPYKPVFIAFGYLSDYKLVFDGYSRVRQGLVADLRKSKGSKTPYVIWEISSEDAISKLDSCEGFISEGNPTNLYERVPIEIPGYSNVVVYLMTEYNISRRGDCRSINPTYIETIRDGYKDFGLDQDYLDYAIREVSKL
jgi:hypothetical protein